jgi:hypothetical protein
MRKMMEPSPTISAEGKSEPAARYKRNDVLEAPIGIAPCAHTRTPDNVSTTKRVHFAFWTMNSDRTIMPSKPYTMPTTLRSLKGSSRCSDPSMYASEPPMT